MTFSILSGRAGVGAFLAVLCACGSPPKGMDSGPRGDAGAVDADSRDAPPRSDSGDREAGPGDAGASGLPPCPPGGGWTVEYRAPITAVLREIAGDEEGDLVFAAGSVDERLIREAGTWRRDLAAPRFLAVGVAVQSARVWLLSASQLHRRDPDGSWHEESLPVDGYYHSIYGLGTELWAVGSDAVTDVPLVVHRVDGTWRQEVVDDPEVVGPAYAAAMTSDGFFAAGEAYRGTDLALLHRDPGGAWEVELIPWSGTVNSMWSGGGPLFFGVDAAAGSALVIRDRDGSFETEPLESASWIWGRGDTIWVAHVDTPRINQRDPTGRWTVETVPDILSPERIAGTRDHMFVLDAGGGILSRPLCATR